MSATRLAELFGSARAAGRAVFMPFMTAGIPDREGSMTVFEQLAEAGADAYELGIPYSDPLMDGPIIQEASRRALQGGMSFTAGLDLAERVVAATAKPLIVMTYVNPILQAGPESFAARLAEIGVSGVIVADVPLDEAGVLKSALDRAGVGMALFAAPTTGEDRLRAIADAAPAFIYAVADLGVTGERAAGSEHLESLVRRIRAVTATPVVLGLGISTPEQARHAARLGDGVIVGSALVREVLEGGAPASAPKFAAAVHGG